MFVYFALRFWPRAATVAKTAIRINDNITAYSTAVAALSSEKNRIKLFMAYLRRAASASGRERDGIFCTFITASIGRYWRFAKWQLERFVEHRLIARGRCTAATRCQMERSETATRRRLRACE